MVELLRCSCTVCYEIVKTLDLETLKFQDQVDYQENLHHIFFMSAEATEKPKSLHHAIREQMLLLKAT